MKPINKQYRCIVAEGPLWDDRTNTLWFVDILGECIFKMDYSTNEIQKIDVGQQIGCMALCENGDLLLAMQDGIYRMNEQGEKILAHQPIKIKGRRFNDGKVGPDGCFYVGTTDANGMGAFYRLKDGVLEELFDHCGCSNGLDWTVDESRLFYCDTRLQKIEVFDFDQKHHTLLNLLNNCLFRQENAENLKELIKICYIRTHEKLQREHDAIIEKTAEIEEIVESNYRKFDQDSMKSLRKYLEEQNAELRWEISELDHKMNLLEDRMMRFPTFKEKAIRKSVETYIERLKVSDMNLLRNALSDLIHHIVIDNERVKITLCLHRLLGGNEPILATVIEKRDNVAQLINHRKQNLAFASLVVSL